ncbi:MAG: cupin domain-containing protein [Pseudomonadota bacterium]
MSRLAFLSTLLLAASALAADPIAVTPPPALDWATTPEGVAFAPLVGDRFAESYMAMVQLPAGLISPAHTKSADMFGIIVSGAMTHVALGDIGSEVVLPEGSFYHIPAGVPHVSSCVSEVDCVTFLYQDGAFDFVPVAQ